MAEDYDIISHQLPWFFPLCAFIFGAVVGSFLNVVIYRVPAGKSIITPGSHCACGKPIKWYDNIPILSWFILRGKARCCGSPYSFRYPFVEFLTACLFLTCWMQFAPAKAMCAMVFVSCLLCATYIDLDHMIIPDVFTIGLGVLGVLLSLFVPSLHGVQHQIPLIAGLRSGMVSIIGLLIGSGLVLWIALLAEALLRKEAMGFGDVKFVGAIGAFAGWQGAVFSIFGGAIIGTAWMLIAWIWQKLSGTKAPITPKAEISEGVEAESIGFGVQIPFGPMLAVGGAVYFLWAHGWFDRYLQDAAALF